MRWHDIQEVWLLICVMIAVALLLLVWCTKRSLPRPEPVRWVPCEEEPVREMLECANNLLNYSAPFDIGSFDRFTARWLRRVTEPEIDSLVEMLRERVSEQELDMKMRNTAVELLSLWSDAHPEAAEMKLRPFLNDSILREHVRGAMGIDDEPDSA